MKHEFPEATIIKPAEIYGHEDKYLNFYACKLDAVYFLVEFKH